MQDNVDYLLSMFDKTHGSQVVRDAAAKYDLNAAVDYLDSLSEDKRRGSIPKVGVIPTADFVNLDVDSI